MVLNELESGLKQPLDGRERGAHGAVPGLLAIVKEEYEDIVKNEVQKAIAADEEAIALCANYIDNVKAYTTKEKIAGDLHGDTRSPTSA